MGLDLGISAIVVVTLLAGSSICDPQGIPNEQLFVLDASGRSAAISVTPRDESYSRLYHFPTGLSPACSAERTSRCWRLIIDFSHSESGRKRFIALAPLEDAVGLMEFQYDGAELVLMDKAVLNITESAPLGRCTPLEVIRYEEQPIVLCLNDRRNLVSCEVILNRSDISQSSLRHCSRLYTFSTIVNYLFMSNTVPFPEVNQVLFVVQGEVYGIRFDSGNLRPYGFLQDHSCDRISYTGNHVLYVYCRSGQVFEYDLDLQWPTPHLPRNGVPIPCPSPNMGFTVIQGESDIIVQHGSGIELIIAGRNYSSAVCSQSGNLYVSDHLGSITVVDATSRSSRPVNESNYIRHLEVFNGDYLVLQTENPPKILLYDKSLRRIAEKNGEGIAVALVLNLTIAKMPTSPDSPPSTTGTPMTLRLDVKALVGIVIGIAVVIGVVLLIIVVVSIPASRGVFKITRRPSLRRRRTASGGDEHDDQEMDFLAGDNVPHSTTNDYEDGPNSTKETNNDGAGVNDEATPRSVECSEGRVVSGPSQRV